MSSLLHRVAFRLLAHEETVELGSCVHFGGFRYGRGDYNPYETYLHMLAHGTEVAAARARFVEFLQHYRPRHLGEALGVELRRAYPLWQYPWSRTEVQTAAGVAGWFHDPDDCPDILTHFSLRGIPHSRIEEEFAWLEGSLASVRRHGFQPRAFRSSILSRRLIRADGRVAYLIHDGNHRLSALSALGVAQLRLTYVPMATVNEARLAQWPLVRRGRVDAEDARRVLAVYFDGNHAFRTQESPAPVIEATD